MRGSYNYIRHRVDLTRSPLDIYVDGDFLVVEETNADLSNIRISFNDRDFVRLDLLRGGVFTPFKKITLMFPSSELNKYIVFIIGRETRFFLLTGVVVLANAGDLALQTYRARIHEHRADSITLLPRSTRSSSDAGSDVDVSNYVYAEICVRVYSASGTLNVYIEGKDDVTGEYKRLLEFTEITSAGVYWGTITMLAFRNIRVSWELSGTFDFTVSGVFKS